MPIQSRRNCTGDVVGWASSQSFLIITIPYSTYESQGLEFLGPRVEEPSESMSTIEKAAAKLAKRGKSSLGQVLNTPVSQQRAVDDLESKSPEIMQGKSQGFVSSPEHFCDIDLTGLADKGYLKPGDGRSQLAQEMRRIKRPLLLTMQKELNIRTENATPSSPRVHHPPANLIMITSSVPGEGKTYVAINLAISLAAELDHRVLLVDADVSKGGITEQLGIQAHRGLSDLLYETNYVGEDAVLTSNIERLAILPAGGNTDQIDELFASDLMGKIVNELASVDPERVVIFDGPPLLMTTETPVLARHMGQVVVVVEANKTSQDAVAQSVQLLGDRSKVSIVLNKTKHSNSRSYGYGYAQGLRRPAEASSGRAIYDIPPDEERKV